MDIGMAGMFLVGVLSGSKGFMIISGLIFVGFSFFRTRQELKQKD